MERPVHLSPSKFLWKWDEIGESGLSLAWKLCQKTFGFVFEIDCRYEQLISISSTNISSFVGHGWLELWPEANRPRIVSSVDARFTQCLSSLTISALFTSLLFSLFESLHFSTLYFSTLFTSRISSLLYSLLLYFLDFSTLFTSLLSWLLCSLYFCTLWISLLSASPWFSTTSYFLYLRSFTARLPCIVVCLDRCVNLQ